MTPGEVLAAGYRAALLTVAAPIAGTVPMLAIARVTGADWRILAPLSRWLLWLVPAAALLGLAQLATPAPAHLAIWMHPVSVALRTALATGLLVWANRRLAGGTGVTFAAVVLAAYAVLVTPLAADAMLGQAPGHPVSAIGMMLVTEQVAGAGAWALLAGGGTPRLRGDMAKLMIAAALALGYLAFMDYLVIWYGNLPERVGFYRDRADPLPLVALAAGLGAPIALLAPRRTPARERLAGGAVLGGLLVFNAWWIGGGWLALVLAAVLALITLVLLRRRA